MLLCPCTAFSPGLDHLIKRSFVRYSHMVRNKLCWDTNNAVGLPKQRNSYQSSLTFLCFDSPTASFASQYNLFRTMWPDPAKGLFLENAWGVHRGVTSRNELQRDVLNSIHKVTVLWVHSTSLPRWEIPWDIKRMRQSVQRLSPIRLVCYCCVRKCFSTNTDLFSS